MTREMLPVVPRATGKLYFRLATIDLRGAPLLARPLQRPVGRFVATK